MTLNGLYNKGCIQRRAIQCTCFVIWLSIPDTLSFYAFAVNAALLGKTWNICRKQPEQNNIYVQTVTTPRFKYLPKISTLPPNSLPCPHKMSILSLKVSMQKILVNESHAILTSIKASGFPVCQKVLELVYRLGGC